MDSDNYTRWDHFVYYRYKIADMMGDPVYYNPETREFTLTNQAEISITSKEGNTTSRKVQKTVNVLHPDVPPPPPNNYAVGYKKNFGTSIGMINYIESDSYDGPLMLGFRGRGDGVFYISDLAFTGWINSQIGDSFGVKPYYIVIQDSTLAFRNPTDAAEHTTVPLGKGDYQVKDITFRGWTENEPNDIFQHTYKEMPINQYGKVDVYAAYEAADQSKYYEIIGSIRKVGAPGGTASYEYHSLDGSTLLAGNTLKIPLPKNSQGEEALGFRLVLETKSVYTTFKTINMDMQLFKSQTVRDYMAKMASISRDKATVYNLSQFGMASSLDNLSLKGSYATHLLTRIHGESSLGKAYVAGSLVVDKANQRYSVLFKITQSESITHPDPSYQNILDEGFVIERRSSVFHDLLAPGVSVDLNTIEVTAYSMEQKKKRSPFPTGSKWLKTGGAVGAP